ncbi:hypothetical protein [Enterococcus asini]|uniref:hypothetical protein n=1 Tax=Enterococcus asini TaxID=57732 RepID=UPI00266D9C9C|nr:hypothetical protein [Enterococcus asini]
MREEGCRYCNQFLELDVSDDGNLELGIYDDDYEYRLYATFDDGINQTWYTETLINYCPMCGRKLEVAE